MFCEKISQKSQESSRVGVFFEGNSRPKVLGTAFLKEHLWWLLPKIAKV